LHTLIFTIHHKDKNLVTETTELKKKAIFYMFFEMAWGKGKLLCQTRVGVLVIQIFVRTMCNIVCWIRDFGFARKLFNLTLILLTWKIWWARIMPANG